MKRKKLFSVSLAMLLTIGVTFSGCSGTAPTISQGSTQSSAPASKGKTSITIWTNLDNETKTLQKYAAKWSQETGNKVTVIHQTPDLQKFAQAVKSPEGPDAVFGIANDQLASYVAAGLVQEVPDSVFSDSDYADAAVKACYINGKKYAVPIAVETNALFFNTKKIKAAPATWDELISEAKSNGGIQFDATSIYYDLGFLYAYGSYIFNYKNGKYDASDIGLGSDNAVKAYSYIQKLATEDKFFSSDITSDLAKSNFQNGKTAFYIGGPWDVSGFTAAKTPFAVATMPTLNGKKFVTPVGTQVGFVSSKSQKQQVVWNFFQYLLKNVPEELFKVGNRIPASLNEQLKIDSDISTKVFIKQIAYGEPLPALAEMGQVWTPYSDNMKLLLKNSITPTKAAQNISKQVRDGINLMGAK